VLLGKNQAEMIQYLKDRPWFKGCGWVWDTDSGTIRILESLIKKGLVEKYVRRQKGGYIWHGYRLSKEYQEKEEMEKAFKLIKKLKANNKLSIFVSKGFFRYTRLANCGVYEDNIRHVCINGNQIQITI